MANNIVYIPTFQHTEWVDNIDRVSAGGANGFNVRFNSIEAEFQAISQIMQAINTVLSDLGQVVNAPVTIGLNPVMLPYGSNPTWSSIYWHRISDETQLGTYVEKSSTADQAWGVMPLNLPDGVHLVSLKVLGEQTGTGNVTTELFQEARTIPYSRDQALVSVPGLAGASTAPTQIQGNPIINTATNLYYLLTRVENAAGSTVYLRGFQLTYQP